MFVVMSERLRVDLGVPAKYRSEERAENFVG